MLTERPIWHSRAWLVAVIVLLSLGLILSTVGSGSPAVGVAILTTGIIVAVLVIGWTQWRIQTQRRRYEDELAAWASERATQAERLRIATDLHDLVSHGLGLITVRATAARSITGGGQERERAEALADVERVSRETTTELRRMLTVLRDPGAAPLRPADTLDDLPAVVQAGNAAGLAATFVADDLGDVSPGVQLTTCAVVREGLNNSLRHAGPTDVHVQVRLDGAAVAVEVQDAGPRGAWRSQSGAGHGLAGLRERVSALGGTLCAEPNGPGFVLLARIPDRDGQ